MAGSGVPFRVIQAPKKSRDVRYRRTPQIAKASVIAMIFRVSVSSPIFEADTGRRPAYQTDSLSLALLPAISIRSDQTKAVFKSGMCQTCGLLTGCSRNILIIFPRGHGGTFVILPRLLRS